MIDNVEIDRKDLGELMISAVDYALGRKTGIVYLTTTLLGRNHEKVCNLHRSAIVRRIKIYIQREGVDGNEEWVDILKVLKKYGNTK